MANYAVIRNIVPRRVLKRGCMKRILWIVLCLMVVLILYMVGCSPERGMICIYQRQNSGIWVTGQGEVIVSPDVAELRLGVEAKADTVAEAQTKANVAMNKVMQVLRRNGVSDKDIQTQYFSIYPVTKWSEEEEKEEVVSYRVSNMVLAKIRNRDYESRPLDYRAGIIINAVAEAGGDFIKIQGIRFSVDDPTPYYAEARAKAIENTEEKASKLASLADVKLGEPFYISEGAVWPVPYEMYYEAVRAYAPVLGTSISSGESEITVNVQVAYNIK